MALTYAMVKKKELEMGTGCSPRVRGEGVDVSGEVCDVPYAIQNMLSLRTIDPHERHGGSQVRDKRERVE